MSGSEPGRTYREGRRAPLPPEERWRLGNELLVRYDAGETIRQLAADIGASFGFVQGLLQEVRGQLRPSGRQKGHHYATSNPRTTEGMEDVYGRPGDEER